MADIRSPSAAPEKSPVFAISMVLIVCAGIAGVTLILGGGRERRSADFRFPGVTGERSGGGREGYQPLPLFPQSPVSTNSPVGDTPDVTIIEDTRELLHRLPLDRNTPKGWTNPVPVRPGGG